METLKEINYAYAAKKAYSRSSATECLEVTDVYHPDLKELQSLLILCNQFFYITDLNRFVNVYVSPNVKRIIGAEPYEFEDLQDVYDFIHPEDREFVWNFSIRTLEFSKKYRDILKAEPYSAVFSIDFRMRCSNGKYIRVNRQTSCFKTDNQGNVIYTLSLFTDINHIKQNNFITYAWKADFELDFNIDDLIDRFQHKIITNREIEIIRLLSQGMSAVQIGQKLYISPNTVIKHRKNILHKTGAKNTAELMRHSIENGWI